MKKKRMSNLCRRGFAGLVALVMCIGLFQTAAFAEETENSAGSSINVGIVTVSNDNGSSENSETSTENAQRTDSNYASETGAPNGAENQESVDGNTPSAEDSADMPEGKDDKDETQEAGTVQNDADNDEEQTEGETSEESKEETSEQDGTFDLTQTERPGQSDTVSTGTGTADDQTESGAPETGKNWEIFYDKENGVYKLTFNVDSDAEGDQVVDMTHALELLKQYAQSAEKPEEPVKDFSEPGLSAEDQVKLDVYEAEMKVFEEEDYPTICKWVEMFNYPGYIKEKGLSVEDVVAEFNSIGIGSAAIPVKPDIAEVDKNSPEYQEYLGKLAEYEAAYAEYQKQLDDFERRTEATEFQPGDVLKFMIFLSSSSNHTYKYQEGSFTLATPDFGLGKNPEDGTLGFDGQVLPDKYVDNAKYHVTLRCEPIQKLLVDTLGVDKWDAWNSLPGYVDNQVKNYLADTYGQDTVAANLNAYLLDYYNSKDGTSYKTIDELVKNNPDAKTELTKTATSGNKWFDINNEYFVVDAHLETEKYNQFYQALFSFAYGDKEEIDRLLGEMEIVNGRFEYENDSWTNNGYLNALYYYMAHEEIWETTDKYFQDLLKEGLTADQATWASFIMALNIDGELTGNDWQNTEWSWYNSIKLEQMDIDFSLTKTDEETGEAITDSETGFQVYYIDKVKSDDGTVSDVKLYCTYDAETNSYTFVPTESTVWTKEGKLDINYAMMKDIVYYLQETIAPEGYERDTNVYIIMNEEDYNAMSDEDKAALGEFDKFLETEKSEDGLKVSVQFTNAKVTPPTPEEPTPEEPTPENPTTPSRPERPRTDSELDVPEPEVPLAEMPEEPVVDIPEEDVPLADTPEEIEIPDPEVPMGDVPKTGDAPVFGASAALFCLCGLLIAKLRECEKNTK